MELVELNLGCIPESGKGANLVQTEIAVGTIVVVRDTEQRDWQVRIVEIDDKYYRGKVVAAHGEAHVGYPLNKLVSFEKKHIALIIGGQST